MIRQGDLVVFENGQYGIVTDPARQTVFTSSGCDTFVENWKALRPVHDPTMGVTASFVELAARYCETQYADQRPYTPPPERGWTHPMGTPD